MTINRKNNRSRVRKLARRSSRLANRRRSGISRGERTRGRGRLGRPGRMGGGYNRSFHGAIAQLGERLDRTQEVGGSSPPSSTSGEAPRLRGFSVSASPSSGARGERYAGCDESR